MASSKPVKPSQAEIESAQNLWEGFTKLMKYSIIVASSVLVLLGLIFIRW